MRRHDEREYSFVDATSFALMRKLGIREALAFDGNFAAAGFVELRALRRRRSVRARRGPRAAAVAADGRAVARLVEVDTESAQTRAPAPASMVVVLTNDAAEALADQLDLAALPACPLCLLELAFVIQRGARPRPSTIQRVTWMTWEEIESELRDQVVELRMKEVVHAEEALKELDERAYRGRLARVVVRRLAERMADEIASNRLE